MAFEIVLYKNHSEYNKLDKLISAAYAVEGVLRSDCSIINPIFEIDAINIIGYNYCYIEAFGRYYFISDIISKNTGLWEIRCNVDVLMSFINDINNSSVLLENTTLMEAENYLSDNNVWTSKVKTFTDIIPFSSGLSDSGEYILITAGG